MGWALYGTPLGDAGYAVEDTCHANNCEAQIDRGLAYLCGSSPGDEFGEYGCGRWFCGDHLLGKPDAVREAGVLGSGLCKPCQDRFYEENPGEREREEDAWQERIAAMRR